MKNEYTDISKLPDETFFYVNNGMWLEISRESFIRPKNDF